MAIVERRRDARYDLAIKIKMSRLDQPNAESIDVEVLDVSRTGIGFLCNQELENGAVYQTEIRIWTGDVIHAFVELVRVSKQENGIIYGGIFIGMPESDWCRIVVYETYQEYDKPN
ncbi:MAG: PilZ domain-containing protein [Lachnospiraceae bacterium]|nr:PilZ domain-containing protein [Lachnospiraceae bacterium]